MNHIKSTIAIIFFALASFTATSAKAVHHHSPADSGASLPVELRFMGTVKNQPLLQLNFSGTKDENEFNICITDETGFVLYSNTVKGETFSKQFLLNTEDLGDAILNFEISSKRTGHSVVYKVSPQLTERMNIVKL